MSKSQRSLYKSNPQNKMKTKIIYTLLTFLFIGISTSVSAQTNAVLNYPVPAKKQSTTAKKKPQTEPYATEQYGDYDTGTTSYRKKTSGEKIKEGLGSIGEGVGDFVENESESIGNTASKVQKKTKRFFKRISDSGKRFGERVSKTLNKASDAVSDRQINKKKY